MNWQVGDLALAVGPTGKIGAWTCGGSPPRGSINRVVDLVARDDWVALVFAAYPSTHWTRGWDADSFRKIRPDEHEGNAEDWELLLGSVKHSDIIRAGEKIRQMNEQESQEREVRDD